MYILSDEYNERVENVLHDLEAYYVAFRALQVAARCLRQIISGSDEVVEND